jgi:hypothetical protein
MYGSCILDFFYNWKTKECPKLMTGFAKLRGSILERYQEMKR